MSGSKLKRLLEQLVNNGECIFLTYGQFGRRFGLGDYPRTWANRGVLDGVSRECIDDPNIGLDLTFLLRNAESGLPSVIDGEPLDEENPLPQMVRASQEAQRIIDKFCPGTRNPYS